MGTVRLKDLLRFGILGDPSSAEGEADPDDAGELWAECRAGQLPFRVLRGGEVGSRAKLD